jgi:hypothetical protein
VTLGGIATFSAQPIFSSLTASSAVATDASKGLVSVTNTGTGNNVLATSPTITTPTISSLSSASATALTLQSAGNTAITVDTSQNVGIGTTSPSSFGKLAVVGDGYFSGALGIGAVSTRNLETIKSDANTTFGAAAAQFPLNIRNTDTTANNWAMIGFNQGASNLSNPVSIGAQFASTTTASMVMVTSGSERMRIDSSGNVGIGTSSPSNKLEVQSSANSTTSYIRGTGAVPNNNDKSVLYVSHGGTTGAAFRVRTDAAISASQFAHILVNNVSAACTALQVDQYGTSPIADFTKSGTVAMRIDNSGNVGIGTTSPLTKLESRGTPDSNWGNALLFDNRSVAINQGGVLTFGGYKTSTTSQATFAQIAGRKENATAGNEAGYLAFLTNNNTTYVEAARFDSSGNLLVGMTSFAQSSSTKGFGVRGSDGLTSISRSGDSLALDLYHSSDGQIVRFSNTSSTAVGNINAGSSTTAYNTTSDYRLKENVTPMTGALATVAQLKPVTYKWKSTGENGQGFIAHELQAVVPDCVSGEKDAVDADGNPQYQGVDTSFLVATLTAAIQELSAKNDALTARIVALESK